MNPFQDEAYRIINQARFDHLAGLSLPFEGKSVLEVGAGAGDQTHFILRTLRAGSVMATDGREENVKKIRERFKNDHRVTSGVVDVENTNQQFRLDWVHCYGLLYHLGDPWRALAWMAKQCDSMILETCVSGEHDMMLNLDTEATNDPRSSLNGMSCRPSREWIWGVLSELFPFVYVPYTQPNHPEFITNWKAPEWKTRTLRAVFVASRFAIENPKLARELIMEQV